MGLHSRSSVCADPQPSALQVQSQADYILIIRYLPNQSVQSRLFEQFADKTVGKVDAEDILTHAHAKGTFALNYLLT